MENLGDSVRQLRKEKGWAQEDLARHLDVSLSTVQRWEQRGDKAVRPTRLARKALRNLFDQAGISWKGR
ncbi:hypothetical protein LCGC14_1237880 [marine sediment metagenome]|uniref:HTH cro/C1-type domain-containing protein n=1 Tax=marine sediment metagenome TaxID=412755 RepID=A0A0F9LAR4_9ZZZZ